jgi:host factor-I protein
MEILYTINRHLLCGGIVTEFDPGLPSTRRIQKAIKDQERVELKLSTTEVLTGRIVWQDSECICMAGDQGSEILIWRHSVLYLKSS